MSIFSGSPLRRLWLAPQTTFGTVPNAAGTYTNTGAKFNPYTKADIQRLIDLIETDCKLGTASQLAGIAGRASGKGSFGIPVFLSGAAGTAPNSGLLLKNAYGAETVSAGVSVTYAMADSGVAPFIAGLWNESDSASTHQFAHGGYVTDFTLNLGGNGYFAIDANALFQYVLGSDNFANEDTAGKAGLTTYPAEPSSPTLTGATVPAFLSSTISIGGNSPVEFISAQLSVVTGRKLRMDGGKYPTAMVQGVRKVILRSLKLADSNGTALAANKNAAASKTPGDIVIVQGGVATYTATHTLKSVQLGNYSFSENGEGLDITFDDSPAHTSAVGSINDLTTVLT